MSAEDVTQGPPEDAEGDVQSAARAAQSTPENEAAWQHLEEVCESAERPADAATAYCAALAGDLDRDVRKRLTERALRYHEEWFGDDPEMMSRLLSRILDADPSAEWAFAQLTRVLTVAERWPQLLDTYDRALAHEVDTARRTKLLDDAAQVAKDFAAEPDRAIDYLRQRLALDPDNPQLLSSIERLLERAGRWESLLDLWQQQIPLVGGEAGCRLRLRLARASLERLLDPERALSALGELLDESPGHAEACGELEGILTLSTAARATRLSAFSLLRKNHDAAGRAAEAVAAIEHAIELEADEASRALRRDAGQRLSVLGRDAEAMAHFRALLLQEPTDTDARSQLRRLGNRSGEHALHATALVEAAAHADDASLRASLRCEAARLRRDRLEDDEGAIELLTQVLEDPELSAPDAVSAAHDLAQLLSDAERDEDRLSVLERLSELEGSASARKLMLAQAARLAEALGQTERAISSWRARLSTDALDREAIDSLARLLEREAQHRELLELLSVRQKLPWPPRAAAADQARMARIASDALDDGEAAADIWLARVQRFGIDDESLSALDALLSAQGRFAELSALVTQALEGRLPTTVERLCRLGDLLQHELEQPLEALAHYAHAVELDPAHESARAGLRTLLEVDACAQHAAERLACACERSGDFAAWIQLLPLRLSHLDSAIERAQLLCEAATLQDEKLGVPGDAVASLCRALPLDPKNAALQARLQRLADKTGAYDELAAAYGAAAGAESEQPWVAARLYVAQARVLELRIGGPQAALGAYDAALSQLETGHESGREAAAEPAVGDVLRGIARCAARVADWERAADALLRLTAVLDALDEVSFEDAETQAHAHDAVGDFCAALELSFDAMEQSQSVIGAGISTHAAYAIDMRLARLYEQACGDVAAAERCLSLAIERCPDKRQARSALLALQRQSRHPGLLESLLAFDALDAAGALTEGVRNLDALYEAAEVALAAQDAERAQIVLRRLMRSASALWIDGRQSAGEHRVDACVRLAVDRASELLAARTERAQAARLLVEAAELPFTPAERNDYRLRAARLLREGGQVRDATPLLQEVVAQTPDDVERLEELSEVLEAQARTLELIAVRRRQLELGGAAGDAEASAQRRLSLRLELASLIGRVEGEDGRVATLKENLRERPGHAASVEALDRLLMERNRPRELAEFLSEQATALEAQGLTQEAGVLHGRVAELAESQLEDIPLALSSHQKVAELCGLPAAFGSLAKLHLKRDEPAEAARWLRRRLERAEDQERVSLLLQLARAQLKAHQHDDAVATLRTAFDEAPKNAEVRRLLFEQYRRRAEWSALAQTLSRAASHVSDRETALAYAREAATLYCDALSDAAAAVPTLKRARELAPDDRDLGSMLAESLIAAEEYPQARNVLGELLSAFGLRRSAQRAHVHALLARVMHAEGDTAGALGELEQAHKMDSGNVAIVRLLSEMARDAGETERAERGYRALLMALRHESNTASPDIGIGAVLVELSLIADELGEKEQAAERFESALEVLVADATQAQHAQAVLLKRERLPQVERLLTARLAAERDPMRRASVLDEYASLLEGPLARAQAALPLRFEAVESRPADPELHEGAQRLARELGRSADYAQLLERLLSQASSQAQRYVRCELLLRLGSLSVEAGDLNGAVEHYRNAEQIGVREADVWRAQAACAAARGDVEEQTRILRALADLGEQGMETKTRADALYALCEVQLASAHTVPDGIASLSEALEQDPRYDRAAAILQRACVSEEVQGDLLELYERVARASSDEQLLLSYLELQASRADALPEEVREGAELAARLDQHETAERLMLRAVDLARELPDGEARVAWAHLSLSDRRRSVGDHAGAVTWLFSAMDVVNDPQLVKPRVRALGEAAALPEGDLALGAKVCERLLRDDPTARDAWEPLATIYARMGARERLETLVDETLDSLEAADERNLLRMTYAKLLMAQGDEEAAQAIEVLREVLVEDTAHAEAQALLAELVERHGTAEEVIAMLQSQLDAARSRRDDEATRTTALELGKRLEAQSPEEAAELYRQILDALGDDRALLLRLLACCGDDAPERLSLLERTIVVTDDDEAAGHALSLADLYERAEDAYGMRRALELGAERAPSHEALLSRLEAFYRTDGDAQGLAELLHRRIDHAEHDEGERARLLCELSRVKRDELGDAAGAVTALERAAELLPEDDAVARELGEALNAAGQPERALERMSQALARGTSTERASLLSVRAEAYLSLYDPLAALADLEEAFELSGDAMVEPLEAAFARAHDHAAAHQDPEAQRALALRHAHWARARGDSERAGELLSQWLLQRADDVPAIEELIELRHGDGDHRGVAELCAQALSHAEAEERVRWAVALSEAWERAEAPEEALDELERVYTDNRGSGELRGRLKAIYERVEAHRPLAELLLDDAAECAQDADKVALLKQAGARLLDAGAAERALEALREALSLQPSDFGLVAAVVDACIGAQSYEEANALLDQGLEDTACKRGDRALLSQRKARLANAAGDRQVELSWLEEAFKHDRQNGEICLELADLAEELEAFDTADQALRAIALIKDNPPLSRGEAFLRQSRLWLQRGDTKRATAWARKAKQELPDSEQVEAILEQLNTQRRMSGPVG